MPATPAESRTAQTVLAPVDSAPMTVRHPELVQQRFTSAPPAIAATPEPFSSSAEINQLITGLAAAQLAFDIIARSKTALVDSKRTGVKYSYDYADLAAVLAAVRPSLAQNGIAIIQAPDARGGVVTVTTILAHQSGQFIRNALTVKLESLDPQALGSAITYLRRYALQSLLGVAPEDDDGDAATHNRPAASGQQNRPGQGTVQMPQRQAVAAPPAVGAPSVAASTTAPAPAPALITITDLEPRTTATGTPYWVVAFSNGLKGCSFSKSMGEALERGRDKGVHYEDVVSHVKGNYTYIDELLPAAR